MVRKRASDPVASASAIGLDHLPDCVTRVFVTGDVGRYFCQQRLIGSESSLRFSDRGYDS